jgi:polypeptide N-acetylgalactosaminyltransferase
MKPKSQELLLGFFDQPRNVDGLKIDWHDYQKMMAEKRRVGLGEMGQPAKLSGRKRMQERQIFEQNGYNGLLSDTISLNRSVPDIRHKE